MVWPIKRSQESRTRVLSLRPPYLPRTNVSQIVCYSCHLTDTCEWSRRRELFFFAAASLSTNGQNKEILHAAKPLKSSEQLFEGLQSWSVLLSLCIENPQSITNKKGNCSFRSPIRSSKTSCRRTQRVPDIEEF